MKKKIVGIIAVAAIATIAGWNFQQNKQDVELTGLALENVQALASGESGGKCTGPKVSGECESRNTVPCSDLSGCNS